MWRIRLIGCMTTVTGVYSKCLTAKVDINCFLGRQQLHHVHHAVNAWNHALQEAPQSVGLDCLLSGHGYWLR